MPGGAASGARPQCPLGVDFFIVHRYNKDLSIPIECAQIFDQLDAILVGQTDIDDYQVRFSFRDEFKSLLCGAGLADNCQIVLAADELCQAETHHRMIVDK